MKILFLVLIFFVYKIRGFYSTVHDLDRINCTNSQFSLDQLIEFSKTHKSFVVCAVHILNSTIYIQNHWNQTLKVTPTRQKVNFEKVQPLYLSKRQYEIEDDKWKFLYLTHGAVNIFHILLDDLLPTFRFFGNKFFESVDIDIVLLGKIKKYNPLINIYSILSHNNEIKFLDSYENVTLSKVIFANGHLESYTRPLLRKEIFNTSVFNITLSNSSLIEDDYLRFSSFIKQKYHMNHIVSSKEQSTMCPRHIPLIHDSNVNNCIFTVIHRPISRRRKVLNENEFISLLQTFSNLDIQIVSLENMKFEDQIDSIRNSDILFGVHGAGLIHALWMRKSSMIIEVFSSGFDKLSFTEISQRLGIHHASWYLPYRSNTPLNYDRISDIRDKDIHLEVNDKVREFIEFCINIACYS